MTSGNAVLIPLSASVVIGEAILVFGSTNEAGAKCYNIQYVDSNFCLSPSAYTIALGLCALLFAVGVLMLFRGRSEA